MRRIATFSFLAFAAPLAASCASTSSTSGAGGASSSSPSAAAAEFDAVSRTLDRYYADLSARDWSAFSSHFAPGAVIACRWKPEGEPSERMLVQTVGEFVAKAPEGPGSKPIFEEKPVSAQVRIDGSVAQVFAAYEARFGEPGKVDTWTGTDAFTLLKHDGTWRIVSLAFDAKR